MLQHLIIIRHIKYLLALLHAVYLVAHVCMSEQTNKDTLILIYHQE